MAAPTALAGAGAGASAGAILGPIGSALGAVLGLFSGIFGNNDNAVISARDKIVKKFRASTPGAANADLFPIKKSDGGTLFSQYGLEHNQIDDRKIGGNYDKEWLHVCEFGANLLFLMYPDKTNLISGDYVAMLKDKKKPDHAFAAIVDFAGPSTRTTEQLRSAGIDEALNVATTPTTGAEIATNNREASPGAGVPTWVYWGGGGLIFLILFGKKLLRL